MKVLDLFCGAGGAAAGLKRAWPHAEIMGVDISAQPRYPFNFTRYDALRYPLEGYDFIWASPPCQAFTAYKRRPEHVRDRPNLIPAIRARLEAAGTPYIIENVVGAPLRDPVLLCGSMFDLDVRRHRLFETSRPVLAPGCAHHKQTPRFAQATNRKNLRRTVEVGVWRIPLQVQCRAMGIDWMNREELSEAIPPAYSEYLAKQMSVPDRHGVKHG